MDTEALYSQQTSTKKEAASQANVIYECIDDCTPDASLEVPVRAVFSTLNVRANDWKTKLIPEWNSNKGQATWNIQVKKIPLDNKYASLAVYGFIGVKNLGRGTAELGNAIVNIQVDKCGDGSWRTIQSAVRSALPTNGKQVGNTAVPTCDGSGFKSYTLSKGARLTVTDIHYTDVFASLDPEVRTVKSDEFKYFFFVAEYTVPISFNYDVRTQQVFTFGNVGLGCQGYYANGIAYKGGDVLYNRINSIVFQDDQGVIPLEKYLEKVILRSVSTNIFVASGCGKVTEFTTTVKSKGGVIGYEELSDSADRVSSVYACPRLYTEVRTLRGIVSLHQQTDAIFFNVKPDLNANRIVRIVFPIVNSSLYSITSEDLTIYPIKCTAATTTQKTLTSLVPPPPKYYTSTELSRDDDGAFTSVWSKYYSDKALVIKADEPGTFTITFTDPDVVRIALSFVGTTSDVVGLSSLNPANSSASSAIAGYLTALFNSLLYPDYADKALTPVSLLLDITPANMKSGLEQEIVGGGSLPLTVIRDILGSVIVGGTGSSVVGAYKSKSKLVGLGPFGLPVIISTDIRTRLAIEQALLGGGK